MSGVKRPFIYTNIIVHLMSGEAAKASKAESLIAGGGVMSEDMQRGQMLMGLRITNPFLWSVRALAKAGSP